MCLLAEFQCTSTALGLSMLAGVQWTFTGLRLSTVAELQCTFTGLSLSILAGVQWTLTALSVSMLAGLLCTFTGSGYRWGFHSALPITYTQFLL